MIVVFSDGEENGDLGAAAFAGQHSWMHDEAHRDHVTTWWSEVFGGPAPLHGGAGRLREHARPHRGLAITPEHRHRFVSLLSLAADDARLPDDPEFRSALPAYAEWGSRLALHNSQPGAKTFEHAPVPRWGGGEAPPFRP